MTTSNDPSTADETYGSDRVGGVPPATLQAFPPAGPRIHLRSTTFYVSPSDALLLETIRRCCVILEAPSLLGLIGHAGVGKSFLMRAMADMWKEESQSTVLVQTADDFRREFHSCEKTNDLENFRRVYTKVSLLVIDDIHHLAQRTAPQGALSELLDLRLRRGLCTWFTAPYAPGTELHLGNRLLSRLSSALLLRVPYPDGAVRAAVFQDLSLALDFPLTDDDLSVLVETSAGKLFAELTPFFREFAHRRISGSPCETLPEIGASSLPPEEFCPLILKETSKVFGVRLTDLRGSTRRKSVVLPRATAMFLMRQLTKLSLVEIGSYFGNRDHTTVLHALKRIREMLPRDAALQRTVSTICLQLGLIETPVSWLTPLKRSTPFEDERCA